MSGPLAQVQDRIAAAAKVARRDADEVTLVAVSKTQPAAAVAGLIAQGQRVFGENRVQEAQAKWPALREAHPDIELHLVGRLQSNKAAEAAALFDAIHSLDRDSLLDALAATERCPPCFVQVNVGDEPQKGGVAVDDLAAMLDRVHTSTVPLAGLMAIPPLDRQAGPYFALLAELARRHGVAGLSMGMSVDYATAAMLGATHVRIGSALFD